MKNYKNAGESVEKHFHKKLKGPKFRRLYETESRKVKIGFMLHQLRIQAGLTQAEIAARVGVTQGYIARLETADAPNYEINTLKKIAIALHKVLVIGFVEETKTPSILEDRELVAC